MGKKIRRIVELLLKEHLLGNAHNIATDFKSNLISRIELNVNEKGYILCYHIENKDDPV